MTAGGGTYTTACDIQINSSIFTGGNNLTFASGGNISVASTASVVISTRDIAAGGNPATASSIGTSGDLSMSAVNITLEDWGEFRLPL